MKSLFAELPAFTRHRSDYLNDEGLRALQNELILKPAVDRVVGASACGASLVKSARKRSLLQLHRITRRVN
jgi:hypothetical protein